MAAQQPEVVIGVHGTFAAKESDEGSEWWQSGSEFERHLAAQLPDHVVPLPRGQVFHWSGKNSASERRAAARELLELLDQLDRQGCGYHLVGHSHGGSVIWDALLLAARRPQAHRRGKPSLLPGLRSWTTVGTPFILSSPSAWRLAAYFFHLSAIGFVLMLLLTASPWAYAVLQRELGDLGATLILLVAGGALYFSLSGAIAGFDSLRVDLESGMTSDLFRVFGDAWLGLCHSQDEAVNGLRTAIQLSGRIVPRRETTPAPNSFISPLFRAPFVPPLIATNIIFNWFVAPLGDSMVWRRIKASATGNDRPGSPTLHVETAPLHGSEVLPKLPTRIEKALVRIANRRIRGAAPLMRQVLTRLANGLGRGLATEVQESGLSGRELIHTCYFENADVVSLIAWHVAARSARPRELPLPEDLSRWACSFRALVAELCRSQPSASPVFWKAYCLDFAILIALSIVSWSLAE